MDILELSSRMIDSGELIEPPMRITNQLSEVAKQVALVESYSNVVAVGTDDGLVLFDASGIETGPAVVEALRRWTNDPFDTIVYTHGHVDHVGGSGAFVADAWRRREAPPRVVGHENIPRRFQRYREMEPWNLRINLRQFGGIRPQPGLQLVVDGEFLAHDVAECTEVYSERMSLCVGGRPIELFHGLGETDDHTWAWVPDIRAVATGDFFTWVFPNAGNPQKVQRFPLEWAASLRAMIALEPELLLPAHALPIVGVERIRGVLDTVASMLEHLVADVVDAMNAGATLDEIGVKIDESLLALPYLRPVYDEPEFVIHNVWRLYGGWWDGNPAGLKPPTNESLSCEIARLAGGVNALVDRAQELATAGDHRLACQLIEYARTAALDDGSVATAYRDIYLARRKAESSLMAKGIYADAARQANLDQDQ
jgi:alkyl sulfatase BDS1-like metallo-beta-lactamase superfamily hydrolase